VEKYHTINGQSVAVKKALPKDQSGKHRGGGGGGYNNNYNNNNYDDDNNYGGNSYGSGSGSGGGNFNFNNLPNNFAQMAQKMFQAAAMQNFNKGST
jgi:hypothetical protein